ncbi:hypothetical protein ACFORH_43220 [Amycolatopsis roodepoortensis]|uniref:Lipoprotein n=1 Tax=Amycolatopsis roodepoortensis TaxID=700274 RepID=A0ABR9LIC3_9PSEU|nr:hypothetical protein [Amycolatopsis roodepoortensis]MBE1580446.1 hypothetical protein [Amycolatopsis roodepoortensis]
MTSRWGRTMVATAAGAAVLLVSGCSSMTWDQKVEELRKIGERGADAHYILLTQNKQPTNDECTANYQLLGDGTPSDEGAGSTPEWRDLHQSYFVDSCVSGKPRVPNTRPADTPASTAPPSTPVSVVPSAKP